jgi:hypothetical protein
MHSNHEIALGQIRDLLGLSPNASPAAVVRAVRELAAAAKPAPTR